MKLSSLSSFKKELAKTPPSLCLILGKNKEEAIESVLDVWQSAPKTWDADQFSPQEFYKEVETFPFLAQKTPIHLREIDQLKKTDLESLAQYSARPAPWVLLLLSGEQLGASHSLLKTIEEKGVVLLMAEEKPWEKEKHLIERLMKEAIALHGVELSSVAAKALVKGIGMEWELLKQELHKLACFVGKKGKIGLEEIHLLSCRSSQETFWQLGEAIFQGNRAEALLIGRRLVQEGEAVFSLFSNLRTQMRQGFEIASLFQSGGAAAVTQSFPYLKGTLLQKKLDEACGYSQTRFLYGLTAIFEAEVEAKNSSIDLHFLLERLLIQLASSHAFTSAA